MQNQKFSGQPTLLQVVASVLSAFLGIQNSNVRERDFTHGKIWIYLVVGLLLTILFVLSIVLVVKVVLANQ